MLIQSSPLPFLLYEEKPVSPHWNRSNVVVVRWQQTGRRVLQLAPYNDSRYTLQKLKSFSNYNDLASFLAVTAKLYIHL